MRYFIFVILIPLLFTTAGYAADFAMTTNAFLDTGALPVLYTCDGKNISPQFSWSDPPAKTQSFALIFSDPDAPKGTFYHWVIYNIPAKTTELPEGVKTLPAGTLVGLNSANKAEYTGPCPPKGTAHTYQVTLYALDTQLKLPEKTNARTVIMNLKDHVLQKVQLTTVYSRWRS